MNEGVGIRTRDLRIKVCSEGFFTRRKGFDDEQKTAVIPRFFAFSVPVRAGQCSPRYGGFMEGRLGSTLFVDEKPRPVCCFFYSRARMARRSLGAFPTAIGDDEEGYDSWE